MTAIAAIMEESGDIWVGGDSAGVAGLSLEVRKDPKVFINSKFIFGFTSSFRMGNILRYSFVPPKRPEKVSLEKYMYTDFINEIRKALKDGGCSKIASNEERGGNFIVGHDGNLFEVQSDFQIAIPYHNFCAVGCGSNICHGSLYSTQNTKLSSKKRIEMALKAAQEFSAGVRGPFVIKCLKRRK